MSARMTRALKEFEDNVRADRVKVKRTADVTVRRRSDVREWKIPEEFESLYLEIGLHYVPSTKKDVLHSLITGRYYIAEYINEREILFPLSADYCIFIV